MRFTDILSENNLPLGPLSKSPIHNEGDLGKLEDALALWVMGDCRLASPHLLAMRDLMAPYRGDLGAVTLYRGLALHCKEDVEKAMRDGLTVHHAGKSLESWAASQEAVEEFMHGFDFWIILSARADSLDTLIDLVTFDRDAHPFTEMHGQDEVIVSAPASQYFTAEQIIVPQSEIEFNRYHRLDEIVSLPKYGDKFVPKHVGPMDHADDDDIAALRWYTGYGSSPINAQLRGHEPEFDRETDDEMVSNYGVSLSNDEGIERIDRLILTAPKRQGSIKVFRGEIDNKVAARYLIMEIGSSYTDPGYLSTTFDPTFAFYGFSQKRSHVGKASNTISMYMVPTSVPGAYMHFDGEATEKEFVIMRGSTYTLIEKRIIPNKNRHYPVSEINLLVWKVSFKARQ